VKQPKLLLELLALQANSFGTHHAQTVNPAAELTPLAPNVNWAGTLQLISKMVCMKP
jgi:hypothetical protein